MNYISGTAHDMMALIEIEEELKKHLEPAKQQAEKRIHYCEGDNSNSQ